MMLIMSKLLKSTLKNTTKKLEILKMVKILIPSISNVDIRIKFALLKHIYNSWSNEKWFVKYE